MKLLFSLLIALSALGLAVAARPSMPTAPDAPAGHGLDNATILIVRHAEKPAGGTGLAPRGVARAAAYASYFQGLKYQGAPLHIGMLVAAADSENSDRPRLTLAPLANATGLPVEQPYPSADVTGLAQWLHRGAANRTILVAWHHSEVGRLVAALGGNPRDYLTGGRWPPSVYDWVIVLRFDPHGALLPAASHLVREAPLLAT